MSLEHWEQYAACAPQNRTESTKHLRWDATDPQEKYDARAVCNGACEVRKECIQFALKRKYIHGVWGGVDDYEIRRALSVDADGEPAERDRKPRCPYCFNRKLMISTAKTAQGYHTLCPSCEITWYIAKLP